MPSGNIPKGDAELKMFDSQQIKNEDKSIDQNKH